MQRRESVATDLLCNSLTSRPLSRFRACAEGEADLGGCQLLRPTYVRPDFSLATPRSRPWERAPRLCSSGDTPRPALRSCNCTNPGHFHSAGEMTRRGRDDGRSTFRCIRRLVGILRWGNVYGNSVPLAKWEFEIFQKFTSKVWIFIFIFGLYRRLFKTVKINNALYIFYRKKGNE